MQIPAGATFKLAQFLGTKRRRQLLQQLPDPQIVSANQVSVQLDNIGGYYYLTGGVTPLINATISKALASRQLVGCSTTFDSIPLFD